MHTLTNKKSNRRAKRNLATPTLRFTPTAWAKLLYLRDYGPTEVGGFGIAAADDLLRVEDVQLVKQTCSLAHVALEDEAVADFFDRQVDEGRRPGQFARLWIHTHPGDCPQPSMTDEATFDRVFGAADWAVMFILASEGQSYARLRFNVGPRAELQMPLEIDYARPFAGCEMDRWKQEYLANVQAPPPDAFDPFFLEPTLGSRLCDRPTGEWYESWSDYVGDDSELERIGQ